MNTTITPELLTRQRNFFLSAIALTLLPNILIDICKYCCYGFHVDVNSTGVEVMFVIIGIIATLSILVLCAYGFYMGNKGYLKKYVAYAFIIYTIYFIIVEICRYIPAVKQFYEGLDTFGKHMYIGIPTIIAYIVMLISVKGSAMNKWMKWLIGLGWFGFCLTVAQTPAWLFTDEEIAANPMMRFVLPRDIVYCAGYVVAAVIIQLYYNRRIKKETLGNLNQQ